MGVIYCLTFPNGKQYVGQTKQKLSKRLSQHQKQNSCQAVHYAIQKYKSYDFEILFEVGNDELDKYEKKFIKELNTIVPHGYNIRDGGTNGCFCLETKQKMSLSHKGKKHSDQTKQAISKALSGRILPNETKQKISESKKSNPISEESLKKMNRKGMKHSNEAKQKISACNAGKTVGTETREKLSKSLRKNFVHLPLYVHRKEQNNSTYHGSGYIVRVPGFNSKSFISKKLSDDEKLKLALNYLESIQNDKRSTTKC
jgi:group I intron endonuclease